ncbi:alpha/beta hydrolase [Sediminibacillus albus]|uniref:Lysophospholipase, alpha-beta hydrolase superfamily n=1 Tax=Sediminibacillus albus TaxID=407036 RepID=A0A1G8YT96_9BACI|nr:alpha/beta hydrolase [Sediminibacillus albus]SDK05957.1 Lysophospholipase, alpha-beta hydrolase superfamily [Sediminibacillus albus]
MKQTSFWLQASDNQKIFVRKWHNTERRPSAIVQLSHGMAEHINRYQTFAQFLTDHNIAVYGNDHRGHGYTGQKQGTMGHLADQHGFNRAVDDLAMVTEQARNDYPSVPVFLLGHSMGSFLARRYIQLYSDVLAGVILSGTGSHPGIVNIAGKLLALLEINRKGGRTPSKLLNKLSFANYNQAFKDSETDFDWLSRDHDEVQSYLQDPFTGFIPTATFFHDLFTGFDLIDDKHGLEKINKDLPFLFITGSLDPVGKQTKGVYAVMNRYYQHGLTNITSYFYEDGRHEMLNEINKEEVFDNILQWITDVTYKRSKENSMRSL